ncbi:MAG TPA: AMP-binding protein [Acidimicrobiales bacterium]|nr:AMP-binding protein [Acidimicrobiales bacterium]
MTILVPDQRSAAPLFCDDLGTHGDRAALFTTGRVITYGELDDEVGRLVSRLGPGRRLVLLAAGNTFESVVAYLAALRGGHPVLLAPADNDESTRALASAYDPDVVIRASQGLVIEERRGRSAHELHPDLALLLCTSGSTGSAKLVRLSRQNVRANATSIVDYLGITEHHRAATTLPMPYCYGLSVVNSHLQAGAGLVLTELSVVDDCFWDLFTASGATSFAGVPHTFDLLDRVGFASMSLPSLRHVTQAGGRLDPAKVRSYADLGQRCGWDFFVMYGQTEATARMAYLPPDLAASHPRSIGVPIPGGAFTIDRPDDDGVGELVYRGPNVMLGYAEQPDDLALGASVEALFTGDLARRTPEGLYEVMGRTSRFVKLFGLRIDLDRVERLLARAGWTAMCTGDDSHVVVAVEAGAGTVAVAGLVSAQLGLPRHRIVVVEFDELPRLRNGKPDHLAVRRRAPEGGGAQPRWARPPASRSSDHAAAIRAAFAEILEVDACGEDSFVSLGGDSLSYVEMSLRLEEILGYLPREWHTTPVGRLSPSPGRRRLVRQTETTIVLRALAIVLVVGTHTKLWHVPGGAHTLLAVAGFNFARFQLRARNKISSIARIALPAMCWIGLVVAIGDKYSWPSALLLNGQFGSPTALWGYWYVEALVQILVVVSLVFAIGGIRRVERRWPFSVALAAVFVGLVVRSDLVEAGMAHQRTSRPHEVFWLFALGWAAARTTNSVERLIVSLLVMGAVPNFFGDPHREAIVVVGILLVVWVPTLPVPWPLNRLVCAVGGASLYIYLTHWDVYPPLSRFHGPAVALGGSILAGVAMWFVARRVMRSEAPAGGFRRNGATPRRATTAPPPFGPEEPAPSGSRRARDRARTRRTAAAG